MYLALASFQFTKQQVSTVVTQHGACPIHFRFWGICSLATPKDKYVIVTIPVNQSRIRRKFTRFDIVETTSAGFG